MGCVSSYSTFEKRQLNDWISGAIMGVMMGASILLENTACRASIASSMTSLTIWGALAGLIGSLVGKIHRSSRHPLIGMADRFAAGSHSAEDKILSRQRPCIDG
jgi:uncharacterized membrane protein YjfL (UPF0719 family)